MRVWFLLAVINALLIAGCAHRKGCSIESRLALIAMDMPKSLVLQVLGRPTQAGTGQTYLRNGFLSLGREAEVFLYRNVKRGVTNEYVVVFMDGKVVQYGPFVGTLRERYDDVFFESAGSKHNSDQ